MAYVLRLRLLWVVCFIAFAWLCAWELKAQTKSYSFLPNIQDFAKTYEISENDEIEVPIRGQKRKLKGFKTFAQYDFDINSPQTYTNAFLMKKFEESVKPFLKGILLQEETRVIYKIEFGSNNLVVVYEIYGEALNYSVTIVKINSLKLFDEEYDAEKLFATLLKDGHVAVYINFPSGNADLTEDAIKVVDQIQKLLLSKPTLKLIVEGHTDNIGSHDKNKKLSLERANSVTKHLIDKGIKASRLSAKGYGPDKPIADNSNEEGRRKNRRVELVKVD